MPNDKEPITCLHCVLDSIIGEYALEVMGGVEGKPPTPEQRRYVIVCLSRLLGEWYGGETDEPRAAELAALSRLHVQRSAASVIQARAAMDRRTRQQAPQPADDFATAPPSKKNLH